MKFTLLMTVYAKEEPEFFNRALKSVLVEQTVLPDQFVLVYDGPLTEKLESVAQEFESIFTNDFDIIRLPKNVGQGAASKAGLQLCKYDLVARMDSDDISYPDRFEQELSVFADDSTVDVVGGFISEFSDDEERITGIRKTAEIHKDIVSEFQKRNPVNNVTVMYKKQALLDIGGYSEERANEDFNLYVRLLLGGKKFYNIQKPIVNVRTGSNMIERRGDISIYKAWKNNQKLLYNGRVINYLQYIRNCAGCYAFVRCPSFMKRFFYKYILRAKTEC